MSYLEIINTAASIASIYHNQKLHNDGVKLANDLHAIEKELSENHHFKEMKQNQIYHQSEVITSNHMQMLNIDLQYKTHMQSYALDLISASRESERDMYEQISARMGHVLVASSIMLSALCTLMFSQSSFIGNSPSKAMFGIVVCLLISSSFSLGCFILCIVKCLRVVFRLTKFMSKKAKTNYDAVKKYISKNYDSPYNGNFGQDSPNSNLSFKENESENIVFEPRANHASEFFENIEKLCDPEANFNSDGSINAETFNDIQRNSHIELRKRVEKLTDSVAKHSTHLYENISDMKRDPRKFQEGSNTDISSTKRFNIVNILFCSWDQRNKNEGLELDFEDYRSKYTRLDERMSEYLLEFGTVLLVISICFWVWIVFPEHIYFSDREISYWPKYLFIAILVACTFWTTREMVLDPDFAN